MGSGNRKLGHGLAMGCGARDAGSRRTGKKTREREREQTAQRRNRELGGTNGCSPRPWAGRAAGRRARKGAPWGRGHQSLPRSVLGNTQRIHVKLGGRSRPGARHELFVIMIISSRGFVCLVSRSSSSPDWYCRRAPLARLGLFSSNTLLSFQTSYV
jgi:hypothetical protein